MKTEQRILQPGAEDLFLEAMAYLDNKYIDTARFNDLYELAIVMFQALYGRVPADVPQYAEKTGRLPKKTPSLLPIAAIKSQPLILKPVHRDYARANQAIKEAKEYFRSATREARP